MGEGFNLQSALAGHHEKWGEPELAGEKVAEAKEAREKERQKERYSASFPGLIDVVEDEKGQTAYLVQYGGDLCLTRIQEINGMDYVPPGKEHLPFILPRGEEVKKWYKLDDDSTLFEDVCKYLARFSCIDDAYRAMLASYIFATYLQDSPDIYYFPEIVFYAPPENGKSRTGKAMTSIAYRGVHLIDLREANIFRYSQNLQASLFFDVKGLWKQAEKFNSTDVFLGRFEKGSRATRVINPDRGAFRDTAYYEIFGPTIIATNEALHNILDTRAISIPLANKPGRYENIHPLKGLELRERLTAWRARMMGRSLPEIEPIPEVQGRLYDIAEPLLQICSLIHPDTLPVLQGVIKDIAGKRRDDKQGTMEGQIVAWLHENAPEGIDTWEEQTCILVSHLNEDRPEGRKYDSRYIGRKLNSMNIITRLSTGGKSRMTVKRDVLDDLVKAYLPTHSTHSTHSTSQGIPRLYEKLNEVERDSHSTFIQPAQTVDSQGKVERVERVESIQGVGTKDGVFVHEEEGDIPDITGQGVIIWKE